MFFEFSHRIHIAIYALVVTQGMIGTQKPQYYAVRKVAKKIWLTVSTLANVDTVDGNNLNKKVNHECLPNR